MRAKLNSLLLLLSLVCLISTCIANEGTCYVRLLHSCTKVSGPIDLSINGEVVIGAQNLATVSGYVEIEAGLQKLSISADVELDVNLEVGTHYTIAVLGDVKASVQVLIDNVAINVNAPLVRVVLLAPLNIDLNVYANLKLLGTLKAHADISATITHQIAISGNVNLSVKNLLGLNVCAKVFAAVNAKAYTVFLIPSLSNSAVFDILVVEDITVQIAAVAKIRLLHGLIRILPAIELVVNGNVVISGSSYGLVSTYASVNVGQVTIQVRISGTTTVLVELPGVTLYAGNLYTICVFGDKTINLKILLDSILALTSGTEVRVGHLAENVESLLVSLVNQPLLHLLPNPINFKAITNVLNLYVAATLTFSSTSLNNVLLSADVNISLGSSCTKLVIGSKTSTTRPLAVITLTTPGLNVNIDVDVALKSLLNLDLSLLKLNNLLLGNSL